MSSRPATHRISMWGRVASSTASPRSSAHWSADRGGSHHASDLSSGPGRQPPPAAPRQTVFDHRTPPTAAAAGIAANEPLVVGLGDRLGIPNASADYRSGTHRLEVACPRPPGRTPRPRPPYPNPNSPLRRVELVSQRCYDNPSRKATAAESAATAWSCWMTGTASKAK
jgi:hypothetical protein